MENDQNLQKFDVSQAELISKNVKTAKQFLEQLLKAMEIEADISEIEKPSATILEITTNDSAFLVGVHGEVMQAIQTILNSQLEKGSRLGKKVLVDINGFRDAQEQKLKEKTLQAIEKCLQTAKPISMDFMNSYERHVVHDIVLEDGRVVSESFGNEPRRFVKIFIK